ncbi:MAG: [acyl-carrier-protein] S-malonyltransferase [Chlamydiae bacterium CG10_big_fil_rev_8_21_14_0_10_35_9]|nr:MAG: [acyl-carrier-protein] S-malonyltransferase [Chlamydiae bacterium CG10_big_fil_rev_8_21_14_0_10_35_9]
MKKFAFLFPGQGAQYSSMGKDFFDTFAIARHTFEEAEDILAFKISDIIFNGSEEELKQTKHSQLAIFVNSVAILKTINQQLPELVPYACAGLSLGEYTALYASQKIDFASALRLVRDRAYFMNDACEKSSGKMAAVMGITAKELEELLSPLANSHQVWVANYNCPGQTVISGTQSGVEYATEFLKKNGAKRVIPLQVHGAFHSGLMMPAQEKLAPKINKVSLEESSIKIVMNTPGDFVESQDEIKNYLIKQVTSSVRWEQSVNAMELHGIDSYIEIGCGKTLANMNKKIGTKAPTKSIDKVIDLDVLINDLEEVGCSI